MAPTQLLYRPLPNPLDELDTVLAKTANMNRIVIISLECGLGRAKYHDSLVVGEGTQELLTFFSLSPWMQKPTTAVSKFIHTATL